MTQKMSIFGSSSLKPTSEDYQEIVELGKVLGEYNIHVYNGGYSGVMEAISKGVQEANGNVTGITCKQVEEKNEHKFANSYLSEEIKVDNIENRVDKLINDADALTVFEGGSGTQYEWVKAYEYMNSNFIDEKPIIFYKADEAIKNYVGYLSSCNRNKGHLFHFVESIEQYRDTLNELY